MGFGLDNRTGQAEENAVETDLPVCNAVSSDAAFQSGEVNATAEIAMQEKRCNPTRFVYRGLPLWIGFEKQNGFWSKIVVSFRVEDNLSRRSIRPYGLTLCSRRYTPQCEKKRPIEKQITNEIVEATLDRVMPTKFLPNLFEECPSIKTGDLTFGLLSPFALTKLHQVMGYEESTEEAQFETLHCMINLWGDWSIKEIIPERCAPELLDMTVTPMKECIRLLRRLFEFELGALVENPRIWHEYRTPNRRNAYHPARAILNTTLNKPASIGQFSKAIDLCERNIKNPVDGAAYLCAMAILTEGIVVEECCALLAGDMVPLSGYEGYYGLNIHQFVETQGNRSRGDGHVRGQRHIVSEYVFGTHERRWLGVSPRLATGWKVYRESHPDVSDEDRLLCDPRNSQRLLAPEDYREWLNDTFRPLFPERYVILQGKTIEESNDIEKLMRVTAKEQLRDFGRYAAEEFRYQNGQKPLAMDGLHYAGFDAPTELVTMALMQERPIRAAKGYCPDELRKNSSKLFGVPGHPKKTTMMHVQIKIPATDHASDIIARMSAEMGFSASFIVKKEDGYAQKTSGSGDLEAPKGQT